MKTTYEKSNEVVSVSLSRFDKKYAKKVVEAMGVKARQKASQALIDYLAKKFGICSVRVNVTERPRTQRRTARGKATYGYYRHLGNSIPVCITIYDTTPCTHKEVDAKVFFNTLVHGFIHHYDLHKLMLDDTPHTAGFYKRISDLEGKLLGC